MQARLLALALATSSSSQPLTLVNDRSTHLPQSKHAGRTRWHSQLLEQSPISIPITRCISHAILPPIGTWMVNVLPTLSAQHKLHNLLESSGHHGSCTAETGSLPPVSAWPRYLTQP
ncbi:hypothetical protein B0T10DRAFT_469869 [Thelonectria olida]|uniref:Secreted protein n=1 Tax=Thelonectria olida TaxID=1576542 RepID=A0A9P8WIZ2_9HYPO|nr:hypothetical protein B0T10DRAFT_469869 [Thelonectria olida]